jgi:hypothetical protein
MFNKTLLLVLALVFIVAFAWNPEKANSQMITDGLIAYWSFDETTIDGTTVRDVVGDSDGTIKGDPQVVAGKYGEGLECDGTDDNVFVDSPAINIDYEQITLECWVYIKGLDDSWNRIISIDPAPDSGDVASLYYDDDDNEYGFYVGVDGKGPVKNQDIVQSDIPLEQWLHMVGVYDGTSAKYYENGELMHEYAISGTIKGGNFHLGIGDRSDGVNADAIIGIVDEVRIYDRALSEAEVQRNFTSPPTAVNPTKKLAFTWGQIKASK